MSNANLILSYIRALAWPVFALIALFLFRNPLRAMLGSIEEFEGFGVRAKIGQRMTQAASDVNRALDNNQIYQTGPPRRDWNARAAAFRMRVAINLRTASSAPADENSIERMKASIEALDMAVNAVLVVIATSDWRPFPLEESAPIPLILIENQLSELTGFTGWSAIIRSRDILRNAAGTICGKEARRLKSSEIIMIIRASDTALAQWRRIVDEFSASAIHNDL